MTMSDQEILDRLKHCPVCSKLLVRMPYNSVDVTCETHGYFRVPFDNQGAPIVWTFLFAPKNASDEVLRDKLHFCPFCKSLLTFNTNWQVKNCENLHGDIRVQNSKVTFDFDEPEYEIVRT